MALYRGIAGQISPDALEEDIVQTSDRFNDPQFIVTLDGSKITGNITGNAANVTGIVPITNGGTGSNTAATAINALLPTQTGNNGKLLYTDGSNPAWLSVSPGTGDVVGINTTVDNTIVRFNGTTGKSIQNSAATLSDAGVLDVPTVSTNKVTLDTAVTPGGVVAGEIQWNSDEDTAELGMSTNVSQHVGMSQYFHVVNQSAYTLFKGAVVMATGTLGNSGKITGALAIANGSVNARYILGVASESITNGNSGFISSFGLIKGIQTNGGNYGQTWTDGTVLYASPTVNGGLTSVEPTAPNLKVVIAIVISAHASNGSLFVRVSHGHTLNEHHNVNITSVANNDSLFYNSTNTRWENKTPANARTALGLVIGTDVQAYDVDTAKLDVVQSWSAKQTFNNAVHEGKEALTGNAIDVSTGSVFTKTISGATALSVSSVPSTGTVASFILELTNGGTNVTWWSGIKWAGGVVPSLSTSGRDVLGFYTHDGGTTWNGFMMGKGMA